jgi:N-acetylglutamate synthase-like GNAT family acetyltransferase
VIQIRRTVEADIPALARIVSQNYCKETAEHFVPEIELSFAPIAFRPWFYTAETLGSVVGCAGYTSSWVSYGAFTLCWVNVDKDRRHEGIGRALVNQCLNDLESRANLIILATSVPEFYERNWKFKVLTKYHGDQMTDTLMALTTS